MWLGRLFIVQGLSAKGISGLRNPAHPLPIKPPEERAPWLFDVKHEIWGSDNMLVEWVKDSLGQTLMTFFFLLPLLYLLRTQPFLRRTRAK